MRLWRDHSLSIVLSAVGILLTSLAIPFREGTTFDVLTGFGAGFLVNGISFAAFNALREKAKPED